MSEHEEQLERDAEQPTLEDEAKEAIREAVEEGYRWPPHSESISEQMLGAEEVGETHGKAVAGEEPGEASQPLDLNAATEEELGKLSGIGPTLAGRIVAYREETGPFRDPADITRVRGISQATYQALADQILAGPVETEAAQEVRVEAPEEAEEAMIPVAGGALPLPEEAAEPKVMVDAEEVAEAGEEPVEVPLAGEEEQRPAAPPPPARQWERQAPPVAPRGVGWGSLLVVGLLSTLAGALLALLVLFLLNGSTLDFERAAAQAIDREVSQLEGQLSGLQTQLDEVRQALGQLGELSRRLDETQSALEGTQAEMGSLQERVGSLQSELAAASEGLADVRQTLAGLSDDLTSVAESVTALDDRVTALDGRLAEIDEQVVSLREATDRFDRFLLGLRELLQGSVPGAASPQSWEATPTSTSWLTPSPTPMDLSPTPSSRVTVIPLATPTP